MTAVFSVLFLMTFSKFRLAAGVVLTVNPMQVEAKPQQAVVLDCQGNARNLAEYISKLVNWKHVANNGTIHKITTGFYLDDRADKTKYEIQHEYSDNSDTNYSFKLKILSVNDDDDGRYVCECEDTRSVILSYIDVNFTVINPVEKVKLEIITLMTGHRMNADSQIMTNSVTYQVEEGEFEVTCTAEGSNPSPQMTLKINNIVQRVDTKMVKSFVGNRPSYKGTFTKVISLSAKKIDFQTVECSAGIPGKQFPDKSAVLKLNFFSGLAADIVLTVNQTEVEAKLQETIVLDCQGNTRILTDYTSKPINWKHVANNGTINKITIGFYLDGGENQTKYDIQHGNSDNSDTNYSFKLKILSVNDDDDGKYICENVDKRLVLLSSKEVNFTVINPVEKVKLEIITLMTGHRMNADSQIMTNNVTYQVEEGEFEVTCTAEGSNPSPQMILKINDGVQYADTTIEKSFVGNRPSYKGNFTKVIYLSADNTDNQTIECSAGIPRKQFPDEYAGLKLKVFSVLPDVECENVSALVTYRQTKLTCRLHSKRALDCSHISWNDGDNNFVIYPGNKTHDPTYGPVGVDCNSVAHENNSITVTTSLTFDQVLDGNFDTMFYIEYSYGKTSHRFPVKIYMKDVSAAVVVKPLRILLCILLAFFVRRISREI
ncbi:hypothetical protein ACJMK2_023872 [Sinanodonta woodiana]|uniref:Ig-like domain-containing protein n=1 Tax=Sinanodonta woodiana TaxID=1069815 RepID=A0ABD3T5U3_SINWO